MIKTKKNKKLRISLILCSLFICICSILCLVPFNNEKTIVKADTTTSVYEFIGSDIYFPNLGIYSLNVGTFNQFTDFIDNTIRLNVKLDYSSNKQFFNVTFSLSSFSANPDARSQHNWFLNNNVNTISLRPSTVPGDLDIPYGVYAFYSGSLYGVRSGNTDYYSYIFVELVYNDISSDVVFETDYGDVVSVELGNYRNKSSLVYPFNVTTSVNGYYNYLSYIFSSGYRLNILLPTTYSTKNSVTYYPYSYFQNRIYNLPNTGSSDYQNGYDAGYSVGYDNGNDIGYNEGYNEGYDLGNNLGYNNGYSEGVESANDYTFLSLISATIDAPVKYFQSLFNFELLGVNLQGFLTGLFTLCVIVTIVKLCLGG